MSPPNNHDLDIYPHIILTSNSDWDPTIMDNEIDITQNTNILDNLPPTNVYGDTRFDALGNYQGTYVSNHHLSHVDRDAMTPSFFIPQDEFKDYVQDCIASCRRAIVTRLDWKAHPPDPE